MGKRGTHRFVYSRPRPASTPEPSQRWALMISVAALTVSFAGTGIALWQAFLTREQIESADRNRSYEALVQQAGRLCDLFYPARIGEHRFYAQSDGTSILAIAREDIHPAIFQLHFRQELSNETRKLRLAFTVAQIWATDGQAKPMAEAEFAVMQTFTNVSPSARLDNVAKQDSFTRKYALASYECTNDGGETTSTLLAGLRKSNLWWLNVDAYKMQVVILPRSELDLSTREQIRARALEQATMDAEK